MSALVCCFLSLASLLLSVSGLNNCGWQNCHQRNESLPIGVHIIPFSYTAEHFIEPTSVVFEKYVHKIYSNVLKSLTSNRNRTFVVSDIGLFAKWFQTLSWDDKVDLFQAVINEQITFVSGFWATPDESITHYSSLIDDLTLGRQWLKKHFKECANPMIAWQLNAYGHSNTFVKLLIDDGYEGLFFSRIDQQLKQQMHTDHSLIFNWKPNTERTIVTILTPEMYSTPPEFSFESKWFALSEEELNAGATEMFVNYVKDLTKIYATNEVFILFGGDFSFSNSEIHYKSVDTLIQVIRNEESYGVDIFYSSPNCYFKSITHGNPDIQKLTVNPWPVISAEEFSPVTDTDDPKLIYSGYYSTNPTLKFGVRSLESLLIPISHIRTIKSLLTAVSNTDSGFIEMTASMQTTSVIGSVAASPVTVEMSGLIQQCFYDGLSSLSFDFMDVLDVLNPLDSGPIGEISICQDPFTRTCKIENEKLDSGSVMYIYNPSVSRKVDIVRVSVQEKTGYSVINWQGYDITYQLVAPAINRVMDNENETSINHHLYFKAILPPLGITTFKIKKLGTEVPDDNVVNKNINYIANSKLKVIFNHETGSIESILVTRTSQLINLKQKFLAFKPGLKSSHLVLDPDGSPVDLPTDYKLISVTRGLLVQEVNQIVNSFINQTIRLYQDKDYLEIEYTIGELPNDTIGMELFQSFQTDLNSNSLLTDSNCRGHVERKLEGRNNKNPTISGKEFFPATCYASIRDSTKNIQMNVLIDRPMAVSSLQPGSIDLLVKRRIPFPNVLIDEGVDYNETITFKNWINFENDPNGLAGMSKMLLWKPVVLFDHRKGVQTNEEMINFSILNQTLDKNLHLLTMETISPENLGDPYNESNQILLRFENMSTEKQVFDTEYLFKKVWVKNLKRMNLAASMDADELIKLKANEVRKSFNLIDTGEVPVIGGETIQTESTTIVTIEPNDIATLIVTLEYTL